MSYFLELTMCLELQQFLQIPHSLYFFFILSGEARKYSAALNFFLYKNIFVR